ncbi:hypothetical protein BCR36DRAFT_580526 [Piromyces finnis]|uniref:Uncharacterized protein n=1 Tax=Piromyces finnis TaxID=1754191 RepID=A0A1Y1VJA4_9FUNG|nr:hypothetical protein BCR36DRAFT_580526 [Piromyces finnis]|eukprot:ORX57111.1 hypothetical protein BCR36DRAFT_580526 [Piromyces finnis]
MVYQNNRQNVMVKGFGNSFMNRANVNQHIQHKQQLNNKTQKPTQKPLRGQNLQQFNNAVHELCFMYDAVNYFGKSEYAKKNCWRVINKHQLNTATIYSIRYAPSVPKRNVAKKQPTKKQEQRPQPKQQPKQQLRQQLKQQQPKQQLRQQPKQQLRQQLKQQQPKQQSRKQGGRRIGGCQFKPNVPRVHNYSTTPLPNNLYPTPKNFNHLFDAFNYFGNPKVRGIKSWIESSRTHKLNSIATVFAKRNAPHVPIRHNRSNRKNQQQGPKKQQQIQRNVPKQQSNRRQPQKNNRKQKNQFSNVWEDYYVSPKQRMFK